MSFSMEVHHPGVHVPPADEAGGIVTRTTTLGADLWFHVSNVEGVPRAGDRVTFKTAPDYRNPAKLRAVQVQIRPY
jgi:hypothetical protein